MKTWKGKTTNPGAHSLGGSVGIHLLWYTQQVWARKSQHLCWCGIFRNVRAALDAV